RRPRRLLPRPWSTLQPRPDWCGRGLIGLDNLRTVTRGPKVASAPTKRSDVDAQIRRPRRAARDRAARAGAVRSLGPVRRMMGLLIIGRVPDARDTPGRPRPGSFPAATRPLHP